jgi:hypothetical protein
LPSEGLRPLLAAVGTSPPRQPPLVEFRALQSVVRDGVPDHWVIRSRHGVIVSDSPARCSTRLRLPNTFVSGSSSRALPCSFRVSRATAGPALMSGHPSLGFRPSSRRQSAESTRHEPPQARTVPSSTFLTSSTGYSSTDLRGFISSRSHVQGFHSSGVSPREKPYELVARRCPRVVTRAPCRRLPGSSRSTRPPSGPCSSHQSVAKRSGLDRALLAPLLSFAFLGFSFPHRRATFITLPTTAFHGPRRVASVRPDLLLRACLPRPRFPACTSAPACANASLRGRAIIE